MPARTAPRATAEQPCSRPPRAFLELGALLTAPGCVRAWTREILWERGLAELADTVEIVVSELVTNSVNASRALSRPVIWLILTLGRGELAILVRDGHPGAPQVRRPGAEDESGRGLLLAETLSDCREIT
jgi:anti-sigma regulatory factor (Ser/Thr protein kinase)